MFYATRRQAYWWHGFLIILWFNIRDKQTNKHTAHTGTKNNLLCAHSSYLCYTESIISWYQKFSLQSSTMPLLFKNYSLVKVTYLLIRFNKTKFFPRNTKNTDRNGVNKQNTHQHTLHTQRQHWKGLVSIKMSNTPFFESTPYTNPSLFTGKIWTPLFGKIPLLKGRRVPTMSSSVKD